MKEKAFKTRYEVAQYLKDRGYKISQAKVYNAVKMGLLRVNADGSVPRSAVQEYINIHLSELAVEADQDLKNLTVKKLTAEYEKLCQQVSMLKFQREKQEGLHIKISEYEAEIASRAAVFESMLRQSNEAVADKLILKAGVKSLRRQLIIDLLNEALMDALAAYVAQDEIIGVVTDENGLLPGDE
ncbi:MAG: hypothetical protein WC202_12240 [Desulfobacterales bacterium]|jgi:hypothetical protein